MPERRDRDRDRFLAEVGSRLDLPERVASEVLEELAGHLDDAAAALRAAGYDAADADHRAARDLGDPGALARELGDARHTRRRQLAAAGGGVRWLIVEGIRTYLFIVIVLALASILAIPVAATILHALGRSSSSYFGGPIGSLVTSAGVIGGLAYLGWVLPARVAAPAVRSVRGVRRAVALVGLVAGSLVMWFGVVAAVDPVLGVGLPLGPVAFALAALRAPERPAVRVGFLPAAVLAVALVIPMTLVALATTTSSEHGGWMADTSPIGMSPGAADPANTEVQAAWMAWGNGYEAVTVDLGGAAGPIAAAYPEIHLEVWPAADVNGAVVFGSAPILVESTPAQASMDLSWAMPRPRDRITTATFIVAVAPGGQRLILASDLGLQLTPPWTGTIAAWWLGR